MKFNFRIILLLLRFLASVCSAYVQQHSVQPQTNDDDDDEDDECNENE